MPMMHKRRNLLSKKVVSGDLRSTSGLHRSLEATEVGNLLTTLASVFGYFVGSFSSTLSTPFLPSFQPPNTREERKRNRGGRKENSE